MNNKNVVVFAGQTGESGASLISVLLAVGLIGGVAYFSMQAYQSLQGAQRLHQASMASRDIEEVILSAIIKKQIDYTNSNRCTSDIRTYFNNFATGATATIRQRPPVFKSLDRVTIIGPPAVAATDVARCNKTKSFDGSTAATSTRHYHCLRIESVASNDTVRHSFAANLGAFIEIIVQFKNLATSQSLTCSTAAVKLSNGVKVNLGNGLEVYHKLHWTIPDSTGKILYKTKNGFLRVAL